MADNDYDSDGSYDSSDGEWDFDSNHPYNSVRQFKPLTTDTIYTNLGNTHDSAVRASVKQSVNNLLKDDLVMRLKDVWESDLDCWVKGIVRRLCRVKHTHYQAGIRYRRLFLHVWQRIVLSDSKDVLMEILIENLERSSKKCFTGYFNATLNTLAGFFDDISITISDSARISGIIVGIRRHISPYRRQVHHDLAKAQLLEMGYDEAVLEPWLTAILEK